ncbi:hypothetical protein [Mariprofundus ferrooxydans]|uniref:hypothetical protein n=1 Tax=Mariprofundus ferrooxydans TaxID=314344 RepID=UPI0014321820|nr:hypothetical protein [Mariprofundus ferrooxydans]
MNWKVEAHDKNIPSTYPIEIISDDKVITTETESSSDGTVFPDDPFSPTSAEKMDRVQKRFAELKAAQDMAAEEASAYRLEMYSHKEVTQRSKLAEKQKELELLGSILRQMRHSSQCRQLMPQPQDYNDVLDELGKRYPHFCKVVELLRARMRLNALKKYPVIDFGTNILLLGAPGCGKSSFLYELGESLGTMFHATSCASSTTGTELTGLSATWFRIIEQLSADIMRLAVQSGTDVPEVRQVKEKFGGLRFYIDGGSQAIYDRIDEAEELSFHVCEVCGKVGKIRRGGWIRTLCEEHSSPRAVD